MTTTLSQFKPAEILANEALAVTQPIASGSAGEISYSTGSGVGLIAAGTVGQVLVSGGAGAPSWSTMSVDAANLTGTTLSASVTTSSLQSVGTLTSLSLSGNISMGGNTISGLSDPLTSTQVATKNYVDNLAQGLSWKNAVQAATTSNLATTYAAGPYYTLTSTADEVIPNFDGYSPSTGDRLLIKDQTNTNENGIYTVTSTGSTGASWVLTRGTDMDTPASEYNGAAVHVINGSTYGNTSWTQIDTVTNLDTDPVQWAQFVSVGGVSSLTASTGISVSAATGAVTVTNTGVISLAGTTNQISVSSTTGAVTLSLPQNINSGAAPNFAGTNFSSIPNAALVDSSLTVTAGSGLSGGGSVSLGGSVTLSNAGVTSIAGTSNQITASASTGSVTLSLPSSISGLTSISATTFTGALSGNATTATNLASGAAGQIPYQTGSSTTGFSSAGTSGQVLLSGGTGSPTWINNSLTVTAGSGLSGGGTVGLGSSVTLTNAGVTSITAGTNISVSNSTGSVTINVSGTVASATTATNATNITTSDDTTTNTSYYPTFQTAAGGTNPLKTSSTKLTFNPSTGTLYATVLSSSSDRNLKKNIERISGALSIVENLDGVYFDWKDSGLPSIGLIAQDVEMILPELVTTSESDKKSLNYSGLVGVLVEAIKEMSGQLTLLKSEITLLRAPKSDDR